MEANAEVRLGLGWIEAVLFADVGQAWGPTDPVALDDLEFTPGVGVRFASPVGPIRLDLAYRFRGSEELPVVTEQIRAWTPEDDENDQIFVDSSPIPWVSTGTFVQLSPRVRFGENDRGFQLHVSIGQAF